jgi:formylmethanofuran dehydrogenase subunit A
VIVKNQKLKNPGMMDGQKWISMEMSTIVQNWWKIVLKSIYERGGSFCEVGLSMAQILVKMKTSEAYKGGLTGVQCTLEVQEVNPYRYVL